MSMHKEQEAGNIIFNFVSSPSRVRGITKHNSPPSGDRGMGRKLLLEKAHVENIRLYDVYRREGGYRSVEKAMKTMGPEAIVEEVKFF